MSFTLVRHLLSCLLLHLLLCWKVNVFKPKETGSGGSGHGRSVSCYSERIFNDQISKKNLDTILLKSLRKFFPESPKSCIICITVHPVRLGPTTQVFQKLF